MPRVHKRKARKAYPKEGIKKGQEYWTWKTRVTVGKSFRGIVHRSATPPSRAQLTNSDYLRSVYSLFDAEHPTTPDDLRQMAESLREIGQEQQEKYDNMPEGLQQGDTGQMLEERANACDSSADELETLADEWEQAEEDHATAVSEYEEAHKEWEAAGGDEGDEPEPEPEAPDDFDPQEFIERIAEHEPEA